MGLAHMFGYRMNNLISSYPDICVIYALMTENENTAYSIGQ